jgi:hypothetical protein
MRGLSISRAWEDTRAIVARDGRLFFSVALALVALPAVIAGLISPKGLGASGTPAWVDILVLIASLIALAGQLALIRLAIGPSITVGGAISHGVYRLPIYFLSALIILAVIALLAFPFALVMTVLGIPFVRTAPMTGPVLIVVMLYFAAICFLGVRMLMAAPVASAEDTGPIAIIRRSWVLTSGNWWRLFGFFVLFLIAAMVLLIGVGSVAGALVRLTFGPIEPLSLSALLVALVMAVLQLAVTILLSVMLARIYVQLAGRGGAEASVPTTGI